MDLIINIYIIFFYLKKKKKNCHVANWPCVLKPRGLLQPRGRETCGRPWPYRQLQMATVGHVVSNHVIDCGHVNNNPRGCGPRP
jgi:hypothetical protein